MARNRKEKDFKVKLKQPDRSGPDPSQETLLDMAQKRGLLDIPQGNVKGQPGSAGADEEPLIGRLGESMLWSSSLTMVHFTLDVLVAHQYAIEISWSDIIKRTIIQAFPVIFLLFYTFHPHPTPSMLLPNLPPRIQPLAHQIFFFITSVAAGTYLIYITNVYSFYAVLKQAPPLGSLWIWSVIELNAWWGMASLICCGIFLKYCGFSIL